MVKMNDLCPNTIIISSANVVFNDNNGNRERQRIYRGKKRKRKNKVTKKEEIEEGIVPRAYAHHRKLRKR